MLPDERSSRLLWRLVQRLRFDSPPPFLYEYGPRGAAVAKLSEFPEEGELVVGTVHKVQNFGAFIQLEEYPGKEGFCHIREVASGWVKRIRDFVREQQRVVCKVQSVNASKGHIDLSLKAVNDHQRRETIQRWKNEQKADKLLEMFAQRIGLDMDQVKTIVVKPCMTVWETMYDAFQDASELGKEVFTQEGIEGDWIDEFVTFAEENIQAQFVEVAGFVQAQSGRSDGVEVLAAALKAAEKTEFEDVQVEVTYKGAPYYRIEVRAPDYKIAEDQLKKAADRTVEAITKAGGEGRFLREIEEKK